MSIQNIINLANDITIDHRPVTGTTMTRSGIARTELITNRVPWRFTVSLPAQPWSKIRPWIGNLNTYSYTPQTVKFSEDACRRWFFGWQGGPIDPSFLGSYWTTPAITVNSFTGTTMNIEQTAFFGDPVAPDGTYLIRSGDLIQLGTTRPYPFMCLTDVFLPAPSVPGATYNIQVHRANFLTGITYPLSGVSVGTTANSPNFYLFISKLPRYRLTPGSPQKGRWDDMARINNAIVEWEGEFELTEWLGDV